MRRERETLAAEAMDRDRPSAVADETGVATMRILDQISVVDSGNLSRSQYLMRAAFAGLTSIFGFLCMFLVLEFDFGLWLFVVAFAIFQIGLAILNPSLDAYYSFFSGGLSYIFAPIVLPCICISNLAKALGSRTA